MSQKGIFVAESKNLFLKTKSIFILKKYFSHLENYKKLSIIKYNKKLQEKLGIASIDFKEETQSEIEIKIKKDYIGKNKGKKIKLINIEENENNLNDYFTIYLSENGETRTIKKNYIEENGNTPKKVKIVINYNLYDFCCLFKGCVRLEGIKFIKIRKKIKNISQMFDCCGYLTSIDLSNFNTENVYDMSYLFNQCGSLTSLNLSNFNTQNVTDMSFMFFGCSMLEHLIINPKKFRIDNVIDMKYMFYECFSINNREKVYLFFQKRLKELGISRRVFFGYEMVIELKKK